MQTSTLVQRLCSSTGNASTRPKIKTVRPERGFAGKSGLFKMACIVFVFCTATAIASPAQTFTTLHSFSGSDGSGPMDSLVQGSDGNFYGTTLTGGSGLNSSGTVFKITPAGVLTTLYSFCPQTGCHDGADPYDGLVQGTDGNFYGTTEVGGAYGDGAIFKMTPGGTLTTIYGFCSQGSCPDGGIPLGGLVQASDGNFYGTTSTGGAHSEGTIFKITPGGALTSIYSFCSLGIFPNCPDGYVPYAGLVQGTDGNLYGTTTYGGANSNGTVFKITPGGVLTISRHERRIVRDQAFTFSTLSSGNSDVMVPPRGSNC